MLDGAMLPSISPPLRITINSARGLRNADWLPGTGKSDPYCTCEVQGKLDLQKIKTKVTNDDLNPVWDHEAEIPGYTVGDALVFNVYDYDFPGPDDLLGTVTLPSHTFVPGGFDGELQLADVGEGGSAFLSIRILPWQSEDAEADASSVDDQFEECIEGEQSQRVQPARMAVSSRATADEDFAVELEQPDIDAQAATPPLLPSAAEVTSEVERSQMTSEVERLQAKVSELMLEVEQLRKAKLQEEEPLQKDIEMLTNRVEQLRRSGEEDVAVREAMIQELHSQLEKASTVAAMLDVEVDRWKQDCAEAEQKVSSLTIEVAQLTCELTEKSQNLQERTAISAAASARSLNLKNEFDRVKAELQEKVRETAANERATATSLLAVAEARIKELQEHGSSAAAAAEKKVQELAQELEQTRSSSVANGQVEEMSKEVEHLRAAHAEAEELVKKLSAEPDPQASNESSVHDATTFKLRAEIIERDDMIKQMARSMEARDAAAGAQTAELQAQIDALVQSSKLGEEALQSNTTALQQEQHRSRQLQAQLQEARASHARAAQQAAKLHQAEVELVQLQKSASGDKAEGGDRARPSSVSEAAALAMFGDLELGRAGSTLADLGLDRVQGLQQVDNALQGFSVLLAWRSDIRLTFSGVWILCHSLYIFHIFMPGLF